MKRTFRLPLPDNAPNLLDRLISRSMEIPSLVPGLALPCWVVKSQTTPTYAQAGGYAAHRLAYTVLREDVPDELVLDHLCGFKPCWNPWHLDPVTEQINIQRAPRIKSNRRKQIIGQALVNGRWVSTYRYVPAKHVRERSAA